MRKFLLFIPLLWLANGFAQITFQKTFSLSQNADEARCVRNTTDRGYIVCGLTEQTNSYHIFLAKFDSAGTLLWHKTYGEIQTFHHYGHAVLQTTDGGYVVSGNYRSGNGQAFLLKTDGSGNQQWFKTYATGESWKVRQTNDKGFILVGTDGITLRTLLVKTDSLGTRQWANTYGINGSSDGIDVKQTNDSGYVAIGTRLASVNENVFLLKVDRTGAVQWAKTYDYHVTDRGYSVLQLASGEYILEGFSMIGIGNTKNFIIKTDNSGIPVWSKVYPHVVTTDFQGFWNELEPTSDSGFVYGTEMGLNPYTTLLVKVNSTGNVQWSKSYGGGYIHATIETPDKGLAFVGWNGTNAYFVKTDQLGNSGCNESPISVTETSALFSATVQTVTVTSMTAQATPVMTTASPTITVNTICSTVGIDVLTEHGLKLFPNPFSDRTVFESPVDLDNATLVLYNCYGQVVKQVKNLNGRTFTLSREELADGAYFLKLTEENKALGFQKLLITGN